VSEDYSLQLNEALDGTPHPFDWNPRYAEFARRMMMTPETCLRQIRIISFSFWIHRELQRALRAWAPCCRELPVRLGDHGPTCLPGGQAGFDRWLREEACDPNPEWVIWFGPGEYEAVQP